MRTIVHEVKEKRLEDVRNLARYDTITSQAYSLLYNHTSLAGIEAAVESLGLPNFRERALDILATHEDFARRRGYDPAKWAETTFASAMSKERSKMKKDIVKLYRKSLDTDARLAIIQYFTAARLTTVAAAFGQNGENFLIEQPVGQEERHRKVIDSRAQATQEFVQVRTPITDGRGKVLRMEAIDLPLPGTVERPLFKLRPVLRWTIDASGRPEWIPDGPQDSVDRNTPPTDEVFDSSLLGLLVLAHLSPGLRANKRIWPEEMFGQKISAVQVPVLASMRRQRLMGHPVVSRARQLAMSTR